MVSERDEYSQSSTDDDGFPVNNDRKLWFQMPWHNKTLNVYNYLCTISI